MDGIDVEKNKNYKFLCFDCRHLGKVQNFVKFMMSAPGRSRKD